MITLRQQIQQIAQENPDVFIIDTSGGIWHIQEAIPAFEAHEFHRFSLDKEFECMEIHDADLPPDYVGRLYTVENGKRIPWRPFYTIRTENRV
ncbi:MAG: hypothetical protein ACYDER_08060 [Ktedonobacteraceae bacterium]